jgi:hypothetical protein
MGSGSKSKYLKEPFKQEWKETLGDVSLIWKTLEEEIDFYNYEKTP